MDGDSAPTPALPTLPTAPAPPTMFGEMRPGQKKKPKPKGTGSQPSFLGSEAMANPSNTGQKQLIGQ